MAAVDINMGFGNEGGLYTPPLFQPDSSQTPSDSTFPECQIFGSGVARIVL